MEPDTRIAVVERDGGPLLTALRGLPVRCEIRRFDDLGANMAELLQFRPQVMVFGGNAADADLPGMIRVARAALDSAPVILVAEPEDEVPLTALAERLGVRILVDPSRPGVLATTIESTLAGEDPHRAGAFLDIARGLADEINNPLMYLSGYLQLLEQGLEPDDDQRRDQVLAAQKAAQRITGTVAKLRLLVESDADAVTPRDLREVLKGIAAPRSLPLTADVAVTAPVSDAQIAALEGLAAMGSDLATSGGRATFALTVDSQPQAHSLVTLDLDGPLLDQWRLPLTFSPYYLNRVLSGTPHGLALFLAQTTLQRDGGQALVRRLPSGGLVLELHWRPL